MLINVRVRGHLKFAQVFQIVLIGFRAPITSDKVRNSNGITEGKKKGGGEKKNLRKALDSFKRTVLTGVRRVYLRAFVTTLE